MRMRMCMAKPARMRVAVRLPMRACARMHRAVPLGMRLQARCDMRWDGCGMRDDVETPYATDRAGGRSSRGQRSSLNRRHVACGAVDGRQQARQLRKLLLKGLLLMEGLLLRRLVVARVQGRRLPRAHVQRQVMRREVCQQRRVRMRSSKWRWPWRYGAAPREHAPVAERARAAVSAAVVQARHTRRAPHRAGPLA